MALATSAGGARSVPIRPRAAEGESAAAEPEREREEDCREEDTDAYVHNAAHTRTRNHCPAGGGEALEGVRGFLPGSCQGSRRCPRIERRLASSTSYVAVSLSGGATFRHL
jgi:hypothetical protein